MKQKTFIKTHKNIVAAVVGAAILLAALGYLLIPRPVSDGYTAVFTTANQFLVGRVYRAPLSRFIELREPYIMQDIPDTETGAVTPQLFDLSVESYWLPESIYIKVSNIVTMGAVGANSAIATKIEEYKNGPTSPTVAN
ncbi:MAG: hypothetical protein PHV43_02580, partial [Candidatus Colwellbacteria bacterium]|nr:hypothetical protein [Candidatus Colwellbacteria bacterium]